MRQRGSRQGRRPPEKLQFKGPSAPRSQAAEAPGAALTVRKGRGAAGEEGSGVVGPRSRAPPSSAGSSFQQTPRPRVSGRVKARSGAPHPTVGSGRKVRAGPGRCSVWGSRALNTSGERPPLAPQSLLFSPPGTGPDRQADPGQSEGHGPASAAAEGAVPCQPGRPPDPCRRQGRALGTEGRRRLGRGGGYPKCDAPTRTWFSTEPKRRVWIIHDKCHS